MVNLFALDRYAGVEEVSPASAITSRQSEIRFAALESGGFIAVWTGGNPFSGSSSGPRARFFNRDGRPVGEEFTVSASNDGAGAAVTVLNSGQIVIAWTEQSPYPGVFEVKAQLFSATGERIGGEFLANTTTNGFQTNPKICALSNGGFAISWNSPQDTTGDQIRAQAFDANGNKVGAEIIVAPLEGGDKYSHSITGLSGGGFVVAWDTAISDVDGNNTGGVAAQRFDNQGNKLGVHFGLATTVAGVQDVPVIDALPGGGFVAIWRDRGGGGAAVRAQFFAEDGSKVGGEILLGTSLGGLLELEVLDNGQVLAAWAGNGGPEPNDIKGRLFDISGTIGEEFVVNSLTRGGQHAADLAVLPSGTIVAGWTDEGRQGDPGDVRMRLFFPVRYGTDESENLTGSAGRDFIRGLAGDDHLVGGAEADGLMGGLGDDSIEAGEGDDEVLGDDGNDRLDGGTGADTLVGGAGNDTYIVDNGGDVVTENANEGTDTIRTGLASYSIAALGNVENLTGTSASGQSLTGNSGANVITGAGGNDRLDGGTGADTLVGGTGNDTYVVDDANDVVTENAYEGTDTIRTSLASYSIAALGIVENLTGTSASGQTLTGNSGANVITGASGNDTLDGGDGIDTARFSGNRSSYTLVNLGGGEVRVTGPDGTDLLTKIERLQFADVTLTVPEAIFAQSSSQASSAFGAGENGGGWTSQNDFPRVVADVNGDGRADIVGFGNAGTYVALGEAGGTFGAIKQVSYEFGQASFAGSWTNNDRSPRMLADVNGDGRADIVGFGEAGTYVALANGQGGFGAMTLATNAFGAAASAGGWESQNLYHRTLGDVNGDGRDDIVGFGINGTFVALANADGTFGELQQASTDFGTAPGAGGWSSHNQFPRMLADVNGDGRADVVGFGNTATYVAYGQANGTFGAMGVLLDGQFGAAPSAGGWGSQDRHPRMAADVNGDNLADIIGFGEAGFYYALNNGAGGFGAVTLGGSAFSAGAGGWWSGNRYPRTITDVNGDGRGDIIGFGEAGVFVTLAAGFVPVTNMTNGSENVAAEGAANDDPADPLDLLLASDGAAMPLWIADAGGAELGLMRHGRFAQAAALLPEQDAAEGEAFPYGGLGGPLHVGIPVGPDDLGGGYLIA